jgi:F-type H+-transporting ATPase subunit b
MICMKLKRKSGHLWLVTWLLVLCLMVSACPIVATSQAGLSSSLLGAQEASPSSHPREGESGGLKETVFKWVNFLILFGGLIFFLRKPVHQFLVTRSAEIQKALVNAKAARQKAEQEMEAVVFKLGQIEQEIAALKAEAGAQAEADRKQVLETAKHEADQIIAAAHEEVGRLLKSARQELREHSAALVVQMAEQKIKSEIRPEHQGPLFEKFIGTLPGSDRPK